MMHRYEVGKQLYSIDFGTGKEVAWIVESPELLGKVPSEEVGIFLEEVFKNLEVVVVDVCVSTAGGLEGEPHIVHLTDCCP